MTQETSELRVVKSDRPSLKAARIRRQSCL